jgi:uncharacterized repeat protein (TIGR03803 family)
MRKLSLPVAVVGLLLTSGAMVVRAQNLITLHSFDGTDGQLPELLVQGTNGSLYATTAEAGANGFGTVFRITPGGTFTLLDAFDATVGEFPFGAPLVQGANQDFYGTLQSGGANLALCGGLGCGTAYRMTPNGALKSIYDFCSLSNCTDGSVPLSGLALASDGNFYGTTSAGGTNCISSGGCGTVFKISLNGTLTTLYSFCAQSNCTDGYYPTGWLIQASNGVFYGTTFLGGTNCISSGGCGTVFKITPNGTLTTLYSFCAQSNCLDGDDPRGLIQAANGDFYGTTKLGGANGAGTIFQLTPSGTVTTVYSFPADSESGFVSVQATDGNFYGTTHAGGANNAGTIFEMTPSLTVTTLYNFCEQSGCTDGSTPVGLIQDTNGNFYGPTYEGGTSSACTSGCGTIFEMRSGLKPFVKTQPAFGKVGVTVIILGTNLTGATSVTFNGTAATITLNSSSEIVTTVPSGATTGTVEVTLPSGVLKSNVVFRVTT